VTAPVAVVVTWRANGDASACLDSLDGVATVLVGNESDAAALAALAAGREGVESLALADNRGFAGGANAGLARAFAGGATHALLLNDDVRLDGGCLEALLATAGDDALAAPVVDAAGANAFTGGALDPRRGFGRHVPGALDFLTGAALMIPRRVWERVGPLDERLFLYYEDVEWTVRARRLGVALRLAPGAFAQHDAGSSSGGGEGATWAYYSTRNRLWFLERERGRAAAVREAANTAARAALRAAVGPRDVAGAKLAGTRDYLRGRLGKGPYPR
jgi:GT2 family glycosyltransferase